MDNAGYHRLRDDLRNNPDMLVLDAALSCWMTARGHMAVLKWLVEQGCNPLDPKQANFMQHLHEEHNAMILTYVLRRMEANEGHVLRSPDGENIVHVLCQLRPEWLGSSIVGYVDRGPDDTGRYLDTWFTEARTSDGQTPLHVWWNGTSKILTNETVERNSPFFEWDVSEALIRAGADVGARDVQGISCARCMIDAASLGSPMPMNAAGVMRALIVVEHEHLDAATPKSYRKRSSSIRL